MKTFKSILTALLVLTMVFAFVACSNSNKNGNADYRTLDDIKESGTINIGVFSDKNPLTCC